MKIGWHIVIWTELPIANISFGCEFIFGASLILIHAKNLKINFYANIWFRIERKINNSIRMN